MQLTRKTSFQMDLIVINTLISMARYETFLQSLGIPFNWYVGKETKHLEYIDLTGPEKVKVFGNIQISLLPKSKFRDEIQEIWDDFWVIIQDLKHDFEPADVDPFKVKVSSWLTKFLTVYQAQDVTPYMHALYAHVPEFFKIWVLYPTRNGEVQ